MLKLFAKRPTPDVRTACQSGLSGLFSPCLNRKKKKKGVPLPLPFFRFFKGARTGQINPDNPDRRRDIERQGAVRTATVPSGEPSIAGRLTHSQHLLHVVR